MLRLFHLLLFFFRHLRCENTVWVCIEKLLYHLIELSYLIVLLIIDRYFNIVKPLEKQVNVSEGIQMDHNLKNCTQRHYKYSLTFI